MVAFLPICEYSKDISNSVEKNLVSAYWGGNFSFWHTAMYFLPEKKLMDEFSAQAKQEETEENPNTFALESGAHDSCPGLASCK